MMLELKRYIADYNYLIARINKAEKLPESMLLSFTEEKYLRLVEELNGLIKQASITAKEIERILGRELTEYEKLNGINI